MFDEESKWMPEYCDPIEKLPDGLQKYPFY